MTSTTTGLPDRYRPLGQVGPDEPTATGAIRCWRAKDRVLNRDVAIRVHTPGGPAAHAWIARALTAGGLATPALAMVYDAAEGTGDPEAPGGAAYVVNEWIDGETLAERLARGPMPEREARTVFRRLAEGVAEAHRVGLAVGGLTPEHVVLRPNGLVGLRAVPAATGTVQGDIAALGALLEACLTGGSAADGPAPDGPAPDGQAPDGGPAADGRRKPAMPSDLAALVRRARSTEPGQALSSVAAMVALLAERPRTGPQATAGDEFDSGWLRRLRERRTDGTPDAPDPSPPAEERGGEAAPVRLTPDTRPPVPPPRAAGSEARRSDNLPGETDEDEDLADTVFARAGRYDGDGHPRGSAGAEEHDGYAGRDDRSAEEPAARRRRVAVVALPLLALAVVIAIAWWIGNNLLSVADSVDTVEGSTPSASAPAGSGPAAEPAVGGPVTVADAEVFDPFGDGEPENDRRVPLSHDGDAATSWATLNYQGSAAFGNLKPGVGVLYDLGSEQSLAGASLTTTLPGSSVELRVGGGPADDLDGFRVVASDELTARTDLAFDEPVTTRYLLVWITSLVPADGGFSADIAEVEPRAAG